MLQKAIQTQKITNLIGRQNLAIRSEMLQCLDKGMTDKSEIYDFIEEKLKVPRPTVRRVCRYVRMELQKKLNVLSFRDYKKESNATF